MIGLVCKAVAEMLQDAFTPPTNYPVLPANIAVTPDEKPFPYQGDYFVAVYGDDFSPFGDDHNVALDVSMGVSVTITRRTSHIPVHQLGSKLYSEIYTSLSSLAWHVMRTIDKKPAVFTKVASYPEYTDITDGGGQLFEYLRWRGTDAAPTQVYEDHFWGKNEALSSPDGYGIMGYTLTIKFGGARAGNRQ